MELKGRIDEDGEFQVATEKGERLCVLFINDQDSDEHMEEFDLSAHKPGLVIVTCESFDGDDAWGVTAVVARADDEDGDVHESQEGDDEAEDDEAEVHDGDDAEGDESGDGGDDSDDDDDNDTEDADESEEQALEKQD